MEAVDVVVSTNQIIFRTYQRLKSDATLAGLLTGGAGVVNGPRRPVGYVNPCVTVGVLTNNARVRPYHHRVTMIINVFVANLTAETVKGQPDIYKLSQIADRVTDLMHKNPLAISGVINCQMELDQMLGPLFDPQDPDEHFMSLRFRAVFR